MFCKVFGPDNDQVLVVRGSDPQDGRPMVSIFFQPEGMDEPCHIDMTWSDTPEGLAGAQEKLNAMTEKEARDMIRQAQSRLEQMRKTH